MRRRITLYIAGSRADLQEDGLVLLNYAATDLTNPAVVKNAWTQSVELPRTPANDRIFGASFRLDRNAGQGGEAGAEFSAGRKTPFAIYTEAGLVLFSGYAKLDTVTRDAYSVTLYGGLGAFLYGLSYDAQGAKRTLADLDYGADLDFTIDAATVAEAWARLQGDGTKPAKWDVINFAPCYNGIPGDFSADKALAIPAKVSVPASIAEGGVTYDATLGNGYTMINLPEAVDEWAAKDLRSYLQRPVLSVRKLLAAIASSANNGGWTVDLSDLAGVAHLDSWLTRPMLPSLGTYNQQGGITPTVTSTPTSGDELARIDLANVPVGAQVTFDGKFRLSMLPSTTPAENTLGSVWYESVGDHIRNAVWFAQAVAYAADDTKIAVSDIYAVKNNLYGGGGIKEIAQRCGYTPQTVPGHTPNWTLMEGQVAFNKDGGGRYVGDTRTAGQQGIEDIALSVTATGIAYVKVFVSRYVIDADSGAYVSTGLNLGGYWEANCSLETVEVGATSTGSGIRSGAQITQQMLLTTKGTPADYLLALCKTFGLYILADAAAKTVQIITRNTFFQDVTEDLTKRIDMDSVEITPLAFDRRWYEWKHEAVGGAFENQYESVEGVQYGIQRVDTNYDFDADAKDVLQGSVLRSCAAVRDAGKYWAHAVNGLAYTPGVIMYGSATQTLWDASGNGKDFAVGAVTAGVIAEGGAYPYHDPELNGRAEFRDADNKGVDGADCLLFYIGIDSISNIALTDDISEMSLLNGGSPCWIISDGPGVDVPAFTRYDPAGPLYLDLGAPRQMGIPGYNYQPDATIYAKRWRDYIADRLDMSGKVLRARVRLDGLQVGPDLLRRFWWYGGSLWSLVKISNYSLTTFDPAECEFVQVRDKSNYLTGQN